MPSSSRHTEQTSCIFPSIFQNQKMSIFRRKGFHFSASLLDMDTVSLSLSNLGLAPPPISTTVAQSSHHFSSLVPSSLGLATRYEELKHANREALVCWTLRKTSWTQTSQTQPSNRPVEKILWQHIEREKRAFSFSRSIRYTMFFFCASHFERFAYITCLFLSYFAYVLRFPKAIMNL